MRTERILRGTWYFKLEGVSETFRLLLRWLHTMEALLLHQDRLPFCGLRACEGQLPANSKGSQPRATQEAGQGLETMKSVCSDLAALTGNVLGWPVGLAHELGIWASCLNLTVCAGCYYVELCCPHFHFSCFMH